MKIGLAFSGGKDSWACLWLNIEKLSDITVIWINTGKNYPELLETVEKAKTLCANFIEVKTDRDLQNIIHGIPSDVVPIDWTTQGQSMTWDKAVKIQSYLGCCYENISKHIHQAAKFYGITHLISGQRIDESHKSHVRNNDTFDGLIHLHPIEHWTKQEVMKYLESKMEIPEHFQLNHSSMDCYDCTAYRKESIDRIEFMEKTHPLLFKEYELRATLLNDAIQEALK